MLRDIKIGDIIGDVFEVKDIFGGNHQDDIDEESGLGVVYLVKNIKNNDVHALKTFQDRFIYEDNTFDDFKFESLEWIKLKPHPNVVNALVADVFDDRSFLFLEPIIPINGKQSLKHYLQDPLDLKQILDWSIQFCHGMEFINASGIKVHGDIKPDNILIFFNRVKISDFGLLELFESYDKNIVEGYYNSNNGIGTMDYMAPEVFDGKRNVESDIYSFGVVLYQLVNGGDNPFKYDESMDWHEIHLMTKIPKFDSVLNDIIHKCLEVDSKYRYHSFKDLRIDLEKIFNERFDNLYKPERFDLDDDAYYGFLGHSYCVYGDIKLFRESYKKALNSNNIFIRYMYADDLMRIQEFEEAKDNFEIVVKNLSSSNEEYIEKDHLYFNLGLAYHSSNQIFDAMDYYEKTLIENNDFLKAKVNLGVCYRILGDYENSCKLYDDVLERVPNFYEALYNKALLLCEYHEVDEAESLFDKIDENLDGGKRFIDKSLIFLEFDKIKSLLELSQYLANHDDIYSRYLLLNLHLAMDKFDSAELVYKDLKSMVDDENYMRIIAALLFYEHGFEEYSFEILEELRTSGSEKCKFESYLLKAYLIKDSDVRYANRLTNHIINRSCSNRQKSEAYNIKFVSNGANNIGYIHNALRLNPNYHDAHLNYIKYYLDNGSSEKALERIKISFKKFKNDSEIYFFKGQICHAENNFKEAKHLFELSLKYGKIEPRVYFYIRDCYIELGDEDKAIEFENYAVMLDKDFIFRDSYKFGC